MAGEKTKIIVIESDVRALKELETKLSPFCTIAGSFQLDRAMALIRSESDAKAIAVSTAKGFDILGLLNSVRREYPHMLRILLTAFEDLTQVVEGLHSGTVQRVISKPIQYAELLGTIRVYDPEVFAQGGATL